MINNILQNDNVDDCDLDVIQFRYQYCDADVPGLEIDPHNNFFNNDLSSCKYYLHPPTHEDTYEGL